MQNFETGFSANDFAGTVIPRLEDALTEESVEAPERGPR
jgi:hypothetical protein